MTPLNKRLPREFKGNLGKWLGIILLLILTISLVAGFLMASSSMHVILSTTEEDYRIEDGRFTANFELSEDAVAKLEDLGVELYENYSYELPLSLEGSDTVMTVRVYQNRESIDLPAYFEGHAPEADDEIALDRVFCANNGLSVGDTVQVNGMAFKLAGIMSLSDYQALFEKNTDFVFNAQSFSVAQVSPDGFKRFEDVPCSYTYSFIAWDRSLDDAARADLEEDMFEVLGDEGVVLTEFLDKDANNAIGYAQDDLEGDSIMWMVLLYLLIVILAFVFVVLTSATIESESAVIGTLLASGYRKGELVRHYLALPLISGVIGAVVGNTLGYAFLIEKMSGLYYNSYSLPPYHTIWDWGVFAQSTLLPLAILVLVTLAGLLRKLRCTPLQFLRGEISRRSKKRCGTLPPALSFSTRFRLRVFNRNLSHFATLLVGILFASLLLLFGMCMLPTVQRYADSLAAGLAAEHTYMLKTPVELDGSPEQREAYAAAQKLADKVDMSAIDKDDLADKVGTLLEDRIVQDVKSQVGTSLLGSKTKTVDLTRYGLGVVSLSALVSGEIDVDDVDFAEVDFGDVSLEDLGLEGVELGGLTLNELFSLVQKARGIDEDAHAVNTQENSPEAIAQAEKFAATSLEYDRGGDAGWESVVLYGIQEGSRYYDDLEVSDDSIVAGYGLVLKFGLSVGDTISLYDKYESKTYEFTIGSIWGSDGTMDVYLPLGAFNEVMGNDPDFFNGYLSDLPLEIDQRYVASDMTPGEMDKIGAQMQDSMGGMMSLMVAVSMAIYIVLMYLLTKTVIERSSRPISYMKVFGYTNPEINRLYLRTITQVVVASLIVAIPIVYELIVLLVKVVFMHYSGNFIVELPFDRIVIEIGLGIACYATVAFLHARRIKKIPLAIALKVQE